MNSAEKKQTSFENYKEDILAIISEKPQYPTDAATLHQSLKTNQIHLNSLNEVLLKSFTEFCLQSPFIIKRLF